MAHRGRADTPRPDVMLPCLANSAPDSGTETAALRDSFRRDLLALAILEQG